MKEYNRKYYDMYNGVKGSQKSFKDIDGDWVESPLISIDNTLHQKSKAADILSCHVEKAILFASNNVWCYEQVCLAEMFKLPKMLLANLLIARVSCWHGKFSSNLIWNTNKKLLLK